ncbi:C40 family peptidase [Streptomyces sp. VMFN-G11Ma]|jgi:cell wall-associated NlpC family hydrolase|uniref:C40 family peptidase n=1 Tax=Streptomyces sp. VMFN-G11Ma TaxID=2135609 RepID=UPI000D3C1A10|nr:C40 family peptidase [Streptomyces sp. VMFN-G11Ma]PTM99535.1 NlpC/P60 family protein [Streptomyces sp. VMFN-G11Ma]
MTRTPHTHGHRTAAALTLLCALTATTQVPAALAAPDPRPATLDEVRRQLDDLYHQSEAATEKYNAADEKARAQAKKVTLLNSQVKAAGQKETRLKALLGSAARAQYRSGGLPAEVQLALAPEPEHALDDAALAQQAQQGTQRQLTALEATRKELRTRTDKAAEELRGLKSSRSAMARDRDKIKARIAAARALESRLQQSQLHHLAELEQQAQAEAQAKWVGTGVLDKAGTKASRAGRKAIAYATRQLGKPYVWGAEGPNSFDCSGLTSQAWLHAGIPIPRTAEEQWARLPHVPVSRMRPGDLIIYFSDASHVALYIGAGKIISAPRPGRWVYVSPAGSMEILGVVRPDA